jgi:hypothetical protein
MNFAGVNYLAVIIAGVAGFAIGAVWYSFLFSRVWMDAAGLDEAEIRERRSPLPFVLAVIADLVMAWVLAVVIGSVWPQSPTLVDGIVAGFLVWLGFTLTTTTVNYAFPGRKPALTVIDAGHWLVVLVVMGAIIGLFG